MKTFKEFNTPATEPATATTKGFPTFEEAIGDKKEGKSCMSETMMEKCNEMYESMCKEMEACHADDSERTAENYMSDCSTKMNEMMEGLKSCCEGCMS
jgi:hypothetical protein